jgi:hypothetical protein
MHSEDRKKLAELALERLEATADDEERWSFLFRTEGAVGFSYCPWSETEDWEFDGQVEGLTLPWTRERLEAISQGEEPNEEELDQWRRAACAELADGSELSRPAWIVPLAIGQEIAGWALFVGDGDDDDDWSPYLEGVFDTFEEAKAALSVEGAVHAP